MPSYQTFQQADRAVRFARAAIDANASPVEALARLYTAVARVGMNFVCPECKPSHDDSGDHLALAAAHDLAASGHELRAAVTPQGLARARDRVARVGALLHRLHPDLSALWNEELNEFARLDGVPDFVPVDVSDFDAWF